MRRNAIVQTKCKFAGCDRPHKAKGYCKPHYDQDKRGATLQPLRSRARERNIGDTCKNGHILEGENLIIRKSRNGNDMYRCRQCTRAGVRISAEKLRRKNGVPKHEYLLGDNCRNGHSLSGDNAVWRMNRGVQRLRCRQCRRDNDARLRKEHPERYEAYTAARTQRRRMERYEREEARASAPVAPGHVRNGGVGSKMLSRRASYFDSLKRQVEEPEELAKSDDDKPTAPWNLLRPKPFARDAWEEFQEGLAELRRDKKAPNCDSRPADFMDYAERGEKPEEGQKPFPDRNTAAALCESCPVFELCKTFSRIEQPVWGVHAGVRFIPDPNDKTGYKGKALF